MCRSRRELSNAYLLAKFGFDTAENEPSKVCPIPQRVQPASVAGLGAEQPVHEGHELVELDLSAGVLVVPREDAVHALKS